MSNDFWLGFACGLGAFLVLSCVATFFLCRFLAVNAREETDV